MTTAASPVPDDLKPHRWTREEFHRMSASDVLPEGARWELLDGEIYPKMGGGNAHITAGQAVAAALRAALGAGFDVSSQYPLPLGEENEPEPDVMVLRGSWRDYDGRDPDPALDVVIAVEVSSSSVRRDQGIKARLYEAAGVPEYWIVNLPDRTLEVRRRRYEGVYGETLILHEGDSAKVGNGAVAVSDILPGA